MVSVSGTLLWKIPKVRRTTFPDTAAVATLSRAMINTVFFISFLVFGFCRKVMASSSPGH